MEDIVTLATGLGASAVGSCALVFGVDRWCRHRMWADVWVVVAGLAVGLSGAALVAVVLVG